MYIYICWQSILEYLITFHEVDFELTDGCYFNQGRNDEIDIAI